MNKLDFSPGGFSIIFAKCRDFLDLFTLNIYSIFLVQEIFERYSGEIEYIFDISSSREIRERFERYSGKIQERLNIYSIFLVQERFERDLGKIQERLNIYSIFGSKRSPRSAVVVCLSVCLYVCPHYALKLFS